MNKYIIELLKLESTVIIPNFGALMKSGKSLIFNSILKYNDGKLEKFIAEQEKMDVQDVSNALAKYVREIIAIIEKGDEFLIVGIGSFYKNDSGKFALKTSFNSDEKPNDTISDEIKEEPKKGNVVTSLYKEKTTKKDSENTPTLTEQDLINSVSTKKTTKEEPKKENPKKETEKIIPPVLPPVKKETEIKKEENTAPKEQKKEEKPKEIVTPAKPITKKENKPSKKKIKEPKPKKEKKKKKGLIWLILLLLILAGGGTYVGLNLEKVKILIGLNKPTENSDNLEENNTDVTSEENETDPEEELMITDTTENTEDTTSFEEDIVNIEDELLEEEPVIQEEEVVVEETPVEVNKELIYHVIVGAFGDENNAIGLVEKLKKEGFSTAKLAGKYGKLTKVAASSHATKQEAENAVEKAKSINEDAFVEKIKL